VRAAGFSVRGRGIVARLHEQSRYARVGTQSPPPAQSGRSAATGESRACGGEWAGL